MIIHKYVCKDREEWLERRRNTIGGSDAAAIVGLNPYMSNVDLWKIKTGRKTQEDISSKDYVRYGTEAEKHLRELFKLDYPQYKVGYEENNIFFSDELPFAHASLDGWLTDENGRNGIWECKTTEIVRSMQKESWKDRIPDNYYIQCLWYLAVTGFDFVVLKAQLKTVLENGNVYLQTKHYFFERSEVEDDIQYLVAKAKDFWKCVEDDKQPALILPEI